jgi:hypothetical protein
MKAIWVHFFFLMVLLGSPAKSEEMIPLADLIANGSEQTYPLVRCAGLYLSGLEWAGEARMGEEATTQTKLVVARLIDLATEMRSVSLGDAASDSVLRDIRLISDMYLVRYETNYASTGQAWGLDAVWTSDSDVCDILLGG